jgi:D-alanyl-lipoteichoic acid acyltransferase DltB (MBOAT superfamily)
VAFNSFEYLALLGASFVLFWGLRSRGASRLWILLLASYAFYAAWNGYYLLLIVASTLIDYCAGQLIHDNEHWPAFRKAMLAVSVVSNLAVLGFFKYGQFALDNAVALLAFAGLEIEAPSLRILLPVGISFYTFQSMSYTFDIYLGKIKPVERARDFFLFVAFFPQLVAGPVVRAVELLPQFGKSPRLDRDDFAEGAWRIVRGLLKKMVIADYLAGAVVDPVFNMPHLFGSLELFIALWGFLAEIYCDFSGYTDIALGSARLFGYRLPENFDTPFVAPTPAAFWRRWHMTLTRFAFDYLYVPLGGNRGGEAKTVRNVLITFAIIGLWHGAEWKYVFFGLYHAVGVIGSRYLLKATAALTGRPWQNVESTLSRLVFPVVLSNVFVVFSLPLFRADDLATAWTIYKGVFAFEGFSLGFTPLGLTVLTLASLAHYLPERWEEAGVGKFGKFHPALQGALITVAALGIARAAIIAKKSFIYFQF